MDTTNQVKVELPASGTDSTPAPAVAVVLETPVGFKAFKLPSGKTGWVVARRKGEHTQLAMRLAGSKAQHDQAYMIFAHIAVKCRVDGQEFTIEDVREMDEDDVAVLTVYAMGNERSLVANT